MKPIIQEEPVVESSRYVAGMIVSRVMVAILMLQQINGNNAPLCEDPRQSQKEQSRAPIEREQNDNKSRDRNSFILRLPVQGWLCLLPPC